MWPADVHYELLNNYVCNHTQLQFLFAKNNFKNPALCRCQKYAIKIRMVLTNTEYIIKVMPQQN